MDVAWEVPGMRAVVIRFRFTFMVAEHRDMRMFGTYPRIVRQTLIQKSTPQPEMRKTPRGGTGWCVSIGRYLLDWILVDCSPREH
jgi:hypothetical protein